jgi:large subunit ribosomal protein L10
LAISKEKKIELVEQYRELIRESRGMIIASYSGIPMKELDGLRRKVRELSGEFHVVKNTLMQLALQEVGLAVPEEVIAGTSAIGFTKEDVPAMAKAMTELAREIETFRLKGGVINGVFYRAQQIERLADLPPLPIVRSQLLSMIQAPAGRIAMALAGSIRQLVNVTKAYSEAVM